MSQIGPFLSKTETGYLHWCPGCEELHHFSTDVPQGNGAQWSFGGDVEKPTFSPSMKVEGGWGKNKDKTLCHYFLREGKIKFLSDCNHKFAGQMVDLPLWNSWK